MKVLAIGLVCVAGFFLLCVFLFGVALVAATYGDPAPDEGYWGEE